VVFAAITSQLCYLRTLTLPVKDKCQACPSNGLDLSKPAFAQFASLSVGVIATDWSFVNC
jgi:hypothetical protein